MENPSILSHVSVGVRDMARSARFYDAVLGTLGVQRMFDEPFGIGYGRAFAEFWIGRPYDGGEPGAGNGTHFAFLAQSREEVDAFWATALAEGGSGDGAPGLRADYSPGYYACFVRDPDGHKIEAHVSEPVGEAPEGDPEAHPT
jgi:catechol 2,3-dioxygenase-like lactoylglutathione lyase family enzyme